MDKLHCVSILNISEKHPTFIAKYAINSNYCMDTILDILDGEELNIEIGGSHAFEYKELKYLMHFINTTELICIVSTKSYKSRLLAQLVDEIKTQYQNPNKSKSVYLILKMCGDKYNDVANVDKIAKTENKINDVKSLMHQNIENALQNCEKLQNLELKAEELSQSSNIFRGGARQLRNKMWWKNVRMKIFIAIIVLVIIGIFIGIMCAIYSPKN